MAEICEGVWKFQKKIFPTVPKWLTPLDFIEFQRSLRAIGIELDGRFKVIQSNSDHPTEVSELD